MKLGNNLNEYDWFITRSVSTTHAIDELAALEDIPVAEVRVGFKHMGTFAEWVESRTDTAAPFITPTGKKVVLGERPRPLIMCEESGGAIFGGTELMWSKSRSRGMLTLREKDGMQVALFTLSLAAYLYNSNQSFADFYCDRVTKNNIKHKYFDRRDVRLYDESLTGIERQEAKQKGMERRDQVMEFFQNLAKQSASGRSLDEIGNEINSKLRELGRQLPRPKRVCDVGDGTLLEHDEFWYLVRASGTDAVLRYYIEGKNREEIEAVQQALIDMRI